MNDPIARVELIAAAIARSVDLLLNDEIEHVDPFRVMVAFAVAAAPDVTIHEIIQALDATGRGEDFKRRFAFPHA